MLTSAHLLQLTLFTGMLLCGQVLFKLVAQRMPPSLDLFEILLFVAPKPAFWAAFGIYSAATLLWMHIISRVPLSIAYPFALSQLALLPLVGWLLFGERVTPLYFAGALLVGLGVMLIVWSAR